MPDIVTIQDALARVMGDVREVAKKDRNTQQNFSFRGVDAVVNAVGPALRRHEVVVLPHVEDVQYVDFQTTKGARMMCCRVVVTYRFVGPGGDFLDAAVPGEAFDSGDKATAKAMSVAFRTALLQALTLPTDDTDPDAQTYERAGESTVANEGMAVTASPSEPRGAAAASGQAASLATSTDGRASVDQEAPAGDGNVREAAAPTPAGASTNYLSREDQALLTTQFGSKIAAINAYKAMFGSHITRLADITYPMRDKLEAAAKA